MFHLSLLSRTRSVFRNRFASPFPQRWTSTNTGPGPVRPTRFAAVRRDAMEAIMRGVREIEMDLEVGRSRHRKAVDGGDQSTLDDHWKMVKTHRKTLGKAIYTLVGGDWNHGLWWSLEWLCYLILGMEKSSQLTKSIIFQRGRYTTNQERFDYGTAWLEDLEGECWELADDSEEVPLRKNHGAKSGKQSKSHLRQSQIYRHWTTLVNKHIPIWNTIIFCR